MLVLVQIPIRDLPTQLVEVMIRIDLANNALPHLDANEFNSWLIPVDQRDEQQTLLATRSDKLIDQLLSHDTLVLAVPMYNMGEEVREKSLAEAMTEATNLVAGNPVEASYTLA